MERMAGSRCFQSLHAGPPPLTFTLTILRYVCKSKRILAGCLFVVVGCAAILAKTPKLDQTSMVQNLLAALQLPTASGGLINEPPPPAGLSGYNLRISQDASTGQRTPYYEKRTDWHGFRYIHSYALAGSGSKEGTYVVYEMRWLRFRGRPLWLRQADRLITIGGTQHG